MINNKLLALLFTLFLGLELRGNTDILNLSNEDTIYISYSIAYFGEYGGADEGIIIFKDEGVLKARYVKYHSEKYNNSSFSLNEQGIIEYFSKTRHDYDIIKSTWTLDSTQITFINQLIDDLKTYVPENGISNASEFYLLKFIDNEYIVIDRLGSWHKYLSIHQCFNIKVVVPKRIYFLGIRVRPTEVKYKI